MEQIQLVRSIEKAPVGGDEVGAESDWEGVLDGGLSVLLEWPAETMNKI